MKIALNDLIILAFFATPLLAATSTPCSSQSVSQMPQALDKVVEKMGKRNDDIKTKWKDDIGEIIKKIKEETKKKDENLKQLKKLKKELLLRKDEFNFYLKQHSELLGKKADVNAL